MAVTCHKKCVTKNDAQNDRSFVSDVKDLSVGFQRDDDSGKAEKDGEKMDEFMDVEGIDDEDEDVEEVYDSIFKDAGKPRKRSMSRAIRWWEN